MKASVLLRIASIVMLLHTIGHTMGAFGWKDAPDAAIKQVIDGMERNHFNFMGRSASLANFYAGYGYTMIGVLLLISLVLWLLSNDTASRLSRQLRFILALFLLCMSVLEYIYFFPLAAGFSLLAGICALLTLKNNDEYAARLS
ncbi:MAG: LIC_13387 family protein [Mucilaginibacter sp.]